MKMINLIGVTVLLFFVGCSGIPSPSNISNDSSPTRGLIFQKGVAKLPGHGEKMVSAFSPDGKLIATGSNDQSVRLWNISNGRNLWQANYKYEVDSVIFSPDNQHVIAGYKHDIVIWDVETGKMKWEFKTGFSFEAQFIAVSPDSKEIMAGEWFSGNVRRWDLTSGEEKQSTEYDERTTAAAYSSNGEVVICSNRRLYSYKLLKSESENENKNQKRFYYPFIKDAYAISYSPDGQYLATGEAYYGKRKETLKVWNLKTGRLAWKGYHGSLESIVYSPDGKLLLTTSVFGETLQIWNAKTGQSILSLNHDRLVSKPSFSPNSRYVVSPDSDQIKVYDLEALIPE